VFSLSAALFLLGLVSNFAQRPKNGDVAAYKPLSTSPGGNVAQPGASAEHHFFVVRCKFATYLISLLDFPRRFFSSSILVLTA
jgi:hypothetical protein